jgi:ABC-type bacteriocin/lantibiotic exporter with double-glycine peptidase domain
VWPRRKKIVPILVAEAGDDATATLTMILRYHDRVVAIEDVADAVSVASNDSVSALDIVNAAASFGLLARGVKIDDPALLPGLKVPNIAHLTRKRGLFPQHAPESRDTYFAVLEKANARLVRLVDPERGPVDQEVEAFLEHSTGIFLLFESGHALPHARVTRV